MPLPTFLLVAVSVGLAAALVGGSELRLSPRHALLTGSFRAYALFLGLVLLPASTYFYAFHGDWFLLYTVDVRRVPSALALLAFILEAGLGTIAFLLGAMLARSQRTSVGYALVGASAAAALSILVLFQDRLLVVGTYAQYRGDFGLTSYGGALMHGSVAMSAIVLVSVAYLLGRIHQSARRA
jgi:hypothetical protein